MSDTASLQENKRHGEKWFPFDIYPCTIPKDFPQVALHWQNSVELVFVKRGMGTVQVGLESVTAMAGDIFVFAPGVLHGLGQIPGETMEYENIIYEVDLLGGSGDLCYRRYLLPLQSGRHRGKLELPAQRRRAGCPAAQDGGILSTADRHESPRLRAAIPRGTGTAAGAGDEAVGANAGTARLKHSRLRKQQRPGCACLRARGAAELRQPALGGQPQFGGCYSAPAVFLRPEFESVLRRFLCFQMCCAGRLPVSPHRSPCVPLCARLRAGVECVPAKAH